ncbi:MAG: iron-molybdenum cofactor biosynthesis protein [FCB group bacterium]|nr:iron-molybdenum cofactor biosynthesis protein [FCB group bacterium]
MKIAVASNDGKLISSHFGRTKGFAMYEIEDEKIVKTEYLPNTLTNHHKHGKDEEKGHHHHSHSAILQTLADCQAVVSRGMGHRLYLDLVNAGIDAYITDLADVEGAVNAYIKHELDDYPERGCSH